MQRITTITKSHISPDRAFFPLVTFAEFSTQIVRLDIRFESILGHFRYVFAL